MSVTVRLLLPQQIPSELRYGLITAPASVSGAHFQIVRPSVPPREILIRPYLEAVRQLPSVEAVYQDDSAGLTVYTVYQGNRRDVEDTLYGAEGAARDQASNTGARFRLLNGPRGDAGHLPASATLLYRRP